MRISDWSSDVCSSDLIGVLDPASARSAVREMFLAHVIGGKGLSRRADFPAMVRGATPDGVLRGVEVLAALVGDVAVVDIGGATTDVHAVIEVAPDTGRTDRTEERRVGKGGVSTCGYRGSLYH